MRITDTDLNRKSFDCFKVSLRRFEGEDPYVGELVELVDGEDRLPAEVVEVDTDSRVAYLKPLEENA